MFLKYSDENKSVSVEETEIICNKCKSRVISINGVEKCGCENDNLYKKSKEIFTQKNKND
jgi:hypothetical protein